jgi:hypothetical protein
MADISQSTLLDRPNFSGDERHNVSPPDLSAEQFRPLGYQVVDWIADFLQELPALPVTCGSTIAQVRDQLGGRGLPATGMPPYAVNLSG